MPGCSQETSQETRGQNFTPYLGSEKRSSTSEVAAPYAEACGSQPRYQASANRPIANNTAVNSPPTTDACHVTGTHSPNLNMAAKINAESRKFATITTACTTPSGKPKKPVMLPVTAVMSVESTSDTRS